jgi:hypothetical protein
VFNYSCLNKKFRSVCWTNSHIKQAGTMKNLIIIIIVLITANEYLIGQSTIGFAMGLNYSDVHDGKKTDSYYSGGKYNSYNSYAFEINYLKRHERLINYRMSFSYISRRFGMNSSYSMHNYERTIDAQFKLGYISFAFLPEISFGKKLRFFFNVGPCIDLLVNGSQSGSNYSGSGVSLSRTNYKASDTFNKFLIGFKSGIGFDYPLTEKIIFQFKTNLSTVFNNFVSGKNLNFVSIHCKNISLTAGVCYIF